MSGDGGVRLAATEIAQLDEADLRIVYNEDADHSRLNPTQLLDCWHQLLPPTIHRYIDAAIRHEWPFLPPDITPNLIFDSNEKLSKLTQKDIMLHCLDCAIQAKNYAMAAALAFVMDRFMYWHGQSEVLLQILSAVEEQSPSTPIAPQLIIRKARVMKDKGNLHGAILVLDNLIVGNSETANKWQYKNESQYINVCAVCVQIKGQIYQNLGLWKEAISPLMQSIEGFRKLPRKDMKGISSSLGLLSRCLCKLSVKEYLDLKQQHPSFKHGHPCYEAYVCGIEAAELSPKQSLFLTKHQLQADESLLMYAVQQPSPSLQYLILGNVLNELKNSLCSHETANLIQSKEQLFIFNKSLYIVCLVLGCSPAVQDRYAEKYLEEICMRLFVKYNSLDKDQTVMNNLLASETIQLANLALLVLGLPELAITKESYHGDFSNPGSANVICRYFSQNESESEKDKELAGVDTKNSDESMLKEIDEDVISGSNSNVSIDSGFQCSSSSQEYPSSPSESVLVSANQKCSAEKNPYPFQQGNKNVGIPITASQMNLFVSASVVKEAFEGGCNDAECHSAEENDSDKLSLVDMSATTIAVPDWPGVGSSRSALQTFFKPPEQPDNAVPNKIKEDEHQFHLNQQNFVPFVDLSTITLLHSMEKLQIAAPQSDQISRCFPTHSLASNNSSNEELQVQKAIIFEYSPVTCWWSAQDTLLCTRHELQLAKGKKGNFRNVYEVFFLHQDEPLGRYVSKRYKKQKPADQYMDDVICQMHAGLYVTLFNSAIRSFKSDLRIHFLHAAHVKIMSTDGTVVDWVNVEPYIDGEFIKLTNNYDYCNVRGKEVSTAFTHFSYQQSNGKLMIVDLQGWLPRENEGVVYLTDPQFHTAEGNSSPCDHGEDGMNVFWKKVHPACNKICESLQLLRPE